MRRRYHWSVVSQFVPVPVMVEVIRERLVTMMMLVTR